MDSSVRNKIDKSFDLVRSLPLNTIKPINRSKLSIKDLKKGSSVVYNDEIYLVTDKYQYYKPKKDVLVGEELQLTNVKTGEVKYVEYSEDDEIEIYVTIREVSKREVEESIPSYEHVWLRDNISDFTFSTERMRYYNDDDWKCRFVRDGEKLEDCETVVKFVEFESECETRYMTFEYWGDGSVEVFLSEEIESHEIEVRSL
jgi:hypothetical protein